jgi:hypothetical protein
MRDFFDSCANEQACQEFLQRSSDWSHEDVKLERTVKEPENEQESHSQTPVKILDEGDVKRKHSSSNEHDDGHCKSGYEIKTRQSVETPAVFSHVLQLTHKPTS